MLMNKSQLKSVEALRIVNTCIRIDGERTSSLREVRAVDDRVIDCSVLVRVLVSGSNLRNQCALQFVILSRVITVLSVDVPYP